MSELYIGVMSGTSMDGVDVALCEVSESHCKLLASLEYPFPQKLREEIIEMIDGTASLHRVGEMNHRLGLLFSEAVNALVSQEDMDVNQIKAVGSHGQTLWHNPQGEYPCSIQLGDASLIAAKTHMDVVSDFRSKDVALGGEGAPFAPVFHQFLFDYLTKAVGVVNIGGIANLSVLQERLVGFDTGPGNVLMDLWIQKHQNLPYDKAGAWAESGQVDQPLLEEMLSDAYFSKSAPKSTGRELFNDMWLNAVLLNHPDVKPQDVQATLLELTVETIANEVKKYKIEHLLVCGGGVKNSFLMRHLAKVLEQIDLSSTDAYGINSEQMEAMLFAWLAYKRMHREAVELKAVTGARHNGILGGVYAKD